MFYVYNKNKFNFLYTFLYTKIKMADEEETDINIGDIISLLYVVIIIMIIVMLWYYGVFSSVKNLFNGSAAETGKNIGEGAGNAVVSFAKTVGDGVIKEIKNLIPPPKKQGEACKLHTDCEGHMPGQNSLACDNGTCKPQMRDWIGVWYTPSECVDAPGRDRGTCSRGFSWPRKDGQECRLNEDCEGFRPGQPGLGCNRGTCAQMKRDFIGVHYNAYECRGGPFSGPGTC